MGFNDFMHSEKGKITTGILAAVLITAAVLVPVSIFTDRAIRGDDSANANSVQVWGYDDQVSSTAEKINEYMGVTMTMTDNIYGGQQVMSGEPALLANSAYHSVADDIQILDGVAGTTEGLGYLSTSWIMGYEDASLTPLKLYNKAMDDRTDNTNYIDPLGDTAEKQTYADTGLQATLNMHMKVPVYVANTITIDPTGATIDMSADSTGQAATYYENITNAGYADDFVMQLGFFNYVATDAENDAIADAMVLPGTDNSATLGSLDPAAMQTAYETITGTSGNSLADAVLAQEANTSQYSIKIDGTGTNTGLISLEVENYEAALNDATGESVDLYYDLTNGGSGEGWKVSAADGGDASSDARQDAFLGTQSRFSEEKEYTEAFWGYTTPNYELSLDDATNPVAYANPTAHATDSVIGFTTGIDLPAFFINEGMTFDYQIRTEAAARALSDDADSVIVDAGKYDINSFTINSVEYAYGETVKVTPTGISDEGAREIFELGYSWQEVMDAGLITGTIV